MSESERRFFLLANIIIYIAEISFIHTICINMSERNKLTFTRCVYAHANIHTYVRLFSCYNNNIMRERANHLFWSIFFVDKFNVILFMK